MGREEQEHEQERQREHEAGIAAVVFLLIGKTGPVHADVLRQMLLDDFFEAVHGLPGAVSACCLAADSGRVEHIESADGAGSGGVVSGAERCHGHHCLVGAAHEEEVEIVAVGAVGRLGLYVYAVYAVEHIEVVDIHRAGEGLHSRENIAHRYAAQLGLVAVNVEEQLRNVGLHRGRQARKFRRFGGIVAQSVDSPRKGVVCGVAARLQHHLEAARGAEARYDGRGEEVYLRLGVDGEFLGHALAQFAQGVVAAFACRLEDYGECGVSLVGAGTGRGAGYVLHVLHVLVGLQERYRALGDGAGALYGGAFGQLKLDGEIALVFGRHKARRYERVGGVYYHKGDAERCPHAARAA